jgi:ABC-type glycerol-3-phosphate transport system substrate-binding protein
MKKPLVTAAVLGLALAACSSSRAPALSPQAFGAGQASLPAAGAAYAPAVTETIVHSFAGGSGGENPHAELLLSDGTLYGTAQNGGANGYGLV